MLSFRLLSLLCTAGLFFTPNLQAAVKAPPNVVFITIDTLRADHLGCYGYKQIQTPNIDALAAHSTRFERAYTPVPVTLPAHTAIFTGTYPTLSGMHDFSGNKLNPTPINSGVRIERARLCDSGCDWVCRPRLALWIE